MIYHNFDNFFKYYSRKHFKRLLKAHESRFLRSGKSHINSLLKLPNNNITTITHLYNLHHLTKVFFYITTLNSV